VDLVRAVHRVPLLRGNAGKANDLALLAMSTSACEFKMPNLANDRRLEVCRHSRTRDAFKTFENTPTELVLEKSENPLRG
jgi:hypothetical protein